MTGSCPFGACVGISAEGIPEIIIIDILILCIFIIIQVYFYAVIAVIRLIFVGAAFIMKYDTVAVFVMLTVLDHRRVVVVFQPFVSEAPI